MDLLAQPALTFAQIGRQLGVTRERVRQLAKYLGAETGRARTTARRETREVDRLESNARSSLLQEASRRAEHRGYPVQYVWNQSGEQIRLRALLINEVPCYLRATERFFPSRQYARYSVVSFRSLTAPRRYQIVIIRDFWGRFWVIPSNKIRRVCYFPRVPQPPTHGAPSQWLPYLENWELLNLPTAKAGGFRMCPRGRSRG